jgi:hypothetical protein
MSSTTLRNDHILKTFSRVVPLGMIIQDMDEAKFKNQYWAPLPNIFGIDFGTHSQE